ncbi:MAG TPA: phage tail tape measure protein [Ruminococcaceae bacterium]|jgi:TP901 family phage tail tape measure protein|nr:phage tail tape measure protein [Oscillospiraceae bacterium]
MLLSAENENDLSGSVGLDTTAFKTGVSDLKAQVKQIETSFRASAAVMGDWSKSTEGLGTRTTSLKDKLKLQKQALATLNEEYKKAASEQGADSKSAQSLANQMYSMEKQISSTERDLKKYNDQLKLQSSRFEQLHLKMQNVSKQAKAIGKSLSSFGQSMTAKVTAPIVAVGVAASKMGMDFEKSSAKVSTIADTASVSMASLKKGVLALSSQTGESASDLNEALYQTISAGVKTGDAMQFLGTATKLAKGGFTDSQTAIDALTTTINAYGLKASDATKISDQLIQTQNLGKTTVAELGGAIGNVIPIAATMSVKTKDLFASLAELTKNGVKTDEAVTGMKSALSSILKPSAGAAKAAKQMGIDFSEAHLKNVGWPAFLEEIKEKTGGSSEKMAELFGNVRALNAVTILAGKGSKDFSSILKQMGDAAGTTDAAFAKVEDSSAEKWQKATNKIKNNAIKLGGALSPLINNLSSLISKAAKQADSHMSDIQKAFQQISIVVKNVFGWVESHGQLVKNLVIGIASAVGVWKTAVLAANVVQAVNNALTVKAAIAKDGLAAGEAALAAAKGNTTLATMALSAATIKDTAQNIAHTAATVAQTAATNAARGAQILFNAALNANPIGIVITLIAALVAALVILYNKNKAFHDWVINSWNTLKNLAGTVGNGIKDAFNGALTGVKSAWSTVTGFFSGIWHGISNAFSTTKSWFSSTFSGAWNGIKSVWSAASGWFGSVWNAIKGHFKPNMISTDFSNAWGSIKSVWGGVGAWFGGVWQSIEDGFKKLNPLQWGKDLLDNFIQGIKSKMEDLRDAVGNIGKTIRRHLHFSEPDEGPLADFHTWMPDFMQGLADGINANKYKVVTAMRSLAADMSIAPTVHPAYAGGYSAPASVAASGASSSYTFYQYNNSPKALSPAETARQTRNLLRQARLQSRK